MLRCALIRTIQELNRTIPADPYKENSTAVSALWAEHPEVGGELGPGCRERPVPQGAIMGLWPGTSALPALSRPRRSWERRQLQQAPGEGRALSSWLDSWGLLGRVAAHGNGILGGKPGDGAADQPASAGRHGGGGSPGGGPLPQRTGRTPPRARRHRSCVSQGAAPS